MRYELQPVDRIDVVTLQDNFIDLAALDGTPMVQRALPIKDGQLRQSIGAEHGFSTLVTTTAGVADRSAVFDFGFSPDGALANADALGLPLHRVETLVLSHGHLDHHGGLAAFAERLAGRDVDLILHPAAFREPRYLKISDRMRLDLPAPDRQAIARAGVRVVETRAPRLFLGGTMLFLGEIPRTTAFEKGFARLCYEQNGDEQWDPTEDDSAIVGLVRGHGLVVLSGCAHSGIINTVQYARALTGVDEVFAVMGGFHLTGADFDPVIAPTVQALAALRPRYLVPAHCTGRKATLAIERTMPEQFLLSMSGTRMVFAD